ncbi:hypothetical protein GCM10007036_28990 [Alsobacter metallidurans]|uniref:Uncharacterized protein n=1 Tax=Alsobacter metallidurans TaxID=340221 RepID=A0A917MIX7_9HYPH|nr:hypothetical protein [Alsobacter metallidurans]GGH23312.1 hypothetical protein GCM10007036_28990 [Alsobacter metallidurans]
MPEMGNLSDEALMTWIVNALMEAQRRGLTTVMLAEPAPLGADDDNMSYPDEDDAPAGSILH